MHHPLAEIASNDTQRESIQECFIGTGATMHGKKREAYKAKFRDPKIAAGLAHKAQQWHALCGELKRQREQESPPIDAQKTVLSMLEKALLVNPDPTHLWNHRRELLKSLSSVDKAAVPLRTELDLTQGALQKGNPKSYGAWFHRKWALVQQSNSKEPLFDSQISFPSVLQNELALTAQFLKLDERNFHCWNYRRFVVSALAHSQLSDDANIDLTLDGSWSFVRLLGSFDSPMGGQTLLAETTLHSSTEETELPEPIRNALWNILDEEWNFTQQKIQDNFSNFSAFHYRSQLLPLLYQRRWTSIQECLEEEFQIIENAMCTEPDDQTIWWYQSLLLDWVCSLDGVQATIVDRLGEQADLLRDLLQEAPESKWVLFGLHRVLSIVKGDKEERDSLLDRLIAVDPDRSQRYAQLKGQA